LTFVLDFHIIFSAQKSSNQYFAMTNKHFFFALIAFFMLFNVGTAQNELLTPERLWQTGRVALECTSPNGQYAIYGVQRYDVAANKGTRVLFLLDIKSGKSRALTAPDKTCSDAAFHPRGGKIGFLEGGKMYEVGLETDAVPILVGDIEMNGFHYAPDGKHILFAQDVKMDKTPTDIYPDLPKTSARISEGLFYRHWKSWHDYSYSNIFYAPYANGKISGTPKNIMNEGFDAPLTPMGGMEQVTWNPAGTMIIYTCRKLSGTAESQSTNSDLYVYELASGRTLNLTEDLPGYDQDPVFSPDGRYLIWTSMEHAAYEADRTRLMLLDTRTQQREELTADWTFEANHPVWAPDSKSVYFLSAEDFTYQVYQIGISEKKPRRLTQGQHDYTNIKILGNQLLATRVAMNAPAEVYLLNPQNGAASALTNVSNEVWGKLAKSKVERRTVKTFDGKDMNVWMILPPNFDPARKYPALLYCQGGPQSALSQGFSYRWNFSLMAAQGYVVIAPCRRGMPGSGQAWNDAITGRYDDAMRDLLAATDAAAKEPFIDAKRIGAVGASFGGFAVYWLAGNHQKRFKTFISHCGMFNLESFYGTTEEVWFPNHDFEGPYWQKTPPRMYREVSPHLFAAQWDTPIFVIHNELDFRVPFGEGMQAFQTAQLRGIPSRFLSFPDEGHWMSKPQNSILWQREFFRWLEQYLKRE
jgi:dipeptidyl aminopeptidase/acylaminoacyl peptidase